MTTIEAMAAHGGSFVRALAEAAIRADPLNLKRLMDAFPGTWRQYAAVAKLADGAKCECGHRRGHHRGPNGSRDCWHYTGCQCLQFVERKGA